MDIQASTWRPAVTAVSDAWGSTKHVTLGAVGPNGEWPVVGSLVCGNYKGNGIWFPGSVVAAGTATSTCFWMD